MLDCCHNVLVALCFQNASKKLYLLQAYNCKVLSVCITSLSRLLWAENGARFRCCRLVAKDIGYDVNTHVLEAPHMCM